MALSKRSSEKRRSNSARAFLTCCVDKLATSNICDISCNREAVTSSVETGVHWQGTFSIMNNCTCVPSLYLSKRSVKVLKHADCTFGTFLAQSPILETTCCRNAGSSSFVYAMNSPSIVVMLLSSARSTRIWSLRSLFAGLSKS